MAFRPCIICENTERRYLFAIGSAAARACRGCGLIGREPYLEPGEIYAGSLIQASPVETKEPAEKQAVPPDQTTELDAAHRYLAILRNAGIERGKIWLPAETAASPIVVLLQANGYTTVTDRPHRIAGFGEDDSFDAVIMLYLLHKVDDPKELLSTAKRRLKEKGLLFFTVPAVDSRAARQSGRHWIHWRLPARHYFAMKQIQLLLLKAGFENIWMTKDQRLYSIDHALSRLREDGHGMLKAAAGALGALPAKITRLKLRAESSGMIVTCSRSTRGRSEAEILAQVKRRETDRGSDSDKSEKSASGTSLSIIMPVFNERQTVEKTLRSVLGKKINGITEREIVLVESNSTDGTRELVRSFEGEPGLKIIYEEKPKGKGHAVRTGFAHARGQILLIQDADSEYDIDDYDELLKPLIDHEELFVLGSRHKAGFKMRSFTDRPMLSLFFNCGQVLFTTLMNVLYNQQMSDPFTMYKVIRRECLYGLKLECNRFDFDHELVIKLLLKGYSPKEIPVNYSSRSYEEGKKVTVVLDPLLWIKANLKFRFVSPFTAEIARQHRLDLSNKIYDSATVRPAKTAQAQPAGIMMTVAADRSSRGQSLNDRSIAVLREGAAGETAVPASERRRHTADGAAADLAATEGGPALTAGAAAEHESLSRSAQSGKQTN